MNDSQDPESQDKTHWDELGDLLGAEPTDEILAPPPEPADVPERPMKRKTGPKRTKPGTPPTDWNSVLGELGLEAAELPDFEPPQEQDEEPIRAESPDVTAAEPQRASEEPAGPAWDLATDAPKSFWGDDEPKESDVEETSTRGGDESARTDRDRDNEGSSRGRGRRGGRRRREEQTEASQASRVPRDRDEGVVDSSEDDDRTGTDRDAPQRSETGRDDSEGGSRDRGGRRRGRGRGDRDRSRRGRRPRSEETASTAEDDDLNEALNEFEVEAEMIFENDVDIVSDDDDEQVPEKPSDRRPRSSRQVPSWQEAIEIIVDSNLAARGNAPRGGGSRGGGSRGGGSRGGGSRGGGSRGGGSRGGGSRGGRRRRPPQDRRD